MTTETPLVDAPEADEQVESQGPKLLTKAQVNHRKGLATRMDQAAKFANRHQIEMLAFYEGVNAPMDIKAPCTAHLVRTVVMHLATYANTEFNEALRMLQAARDEINAKQPNPDETLPIVQAPEAGDEAPVERGEDAG
jgi:hypothetical protein